MDPRITEDLARSGLSPEDINATPSYSAGNPDPFGYKIPYYLPNGDPHPQMYRIKLFKPAADGGKYVQAAGVPIYPYYTPGADWRNSLDREIHYIIEGEKKAAAAWKFLKMSAIGIGGCHNWKGLKNPRLLNGVSTAVMESVRPGAKVVIIFDGDVARNSQVEHGLAELCLALRDEGYIPEVVVLPEGRDGKVGFDDWLMVTGGAGFEKLPRHDGSKLWDGGPSLAYRTKARTRGEHGSIVPNAENAKLIMQKHDYFKPLTYNVMNRTLYWGKERLDDGTVVNLAGKFMHEVDPMYKRSAVEDAIQAITKDPNFQRNPIKDRLEALVWDGESRLNTVFANYFNSPNDPEYLSAVGRNWFTSLVARACSPGCKADNMLILEGAQGIGKSRALRVIGGEYYKESTVHDLGNKDFLVNMAGAWIYDINELRSMRRADQETIKALLSSCEDSFRLPYGRLPVVQPRSCVIVGKSVV